MCVGGLSSKHGLNILHDNPCRLRYVAGRLLNSREQALRLVNREGSHLSVGMPVPPQRRASRLLHSWGQAALGEPPPRRRACVAVRLPHGAFWAGAILDSSKSQCDF